MIYLTSIDCDGKPIKYIHLSCASISCVLQPESGMKRLLYSGIIKINGVEHDMVSLIKMVWQNENEIGNMIVSDVNTPFGTDKVFEISKASQLDIAFRNAISIKKVKPTGINCVVDKFCDTFVKTTQGFIVPWIDFLSDKVNPLRIEDCNEKVYDVSYIDHNKCEALIAKGRMLKP